ncbi:MAG: Na+/H+ antiporter subunit C [Phreatobacter sp.]|jgi:multicomponent K+:H+ antiporter subunit C
MEAIVATAIGILTAGGLYLILRPRSFSVVLGLTLLAYAVNLLIFAAGRLGATAPPLALPGTSGHSDPLPQALVLTAIVIGFGMTAYLVALALRAKGDSGTDHVDTTDGR